MTHGDVGTGGVVHRHHHGKRPGAPLARAVDLLVGSFQRVSPAEAGAPVDADAIGRTRHIEPARRKRLGGGSQCELGRAVEVGGFTLGKEWGGLPVDKRADLHARALCGFGRQPADTGARVAQRAMKILERRAERRDHARPGDRDATLRHGATQALPAAVSAAAI
jgi:hypothetical protein